MAHLLAPSDNCSSIFNKGKEQRTNVAKLGMVYTNLLLPLLIEIFNNDLMKIASCQLILSNHFIATKLSFFATSEASTLHLKTT